jgi:hypothetical protein
VPTSSGSPSGSAAIGTPAVPEMALQSGIFQKHGIDADILYTQGRRRDDAGRHCPTVSTSGWPPAQPVFWAPFAKGRSRPHRRLPGNRLIRLLVCQSRFPAENHSRCHGGQDDPDLFDQRLVLQQRGARLSSQNTKLQSPAVGHGRRRVDLHAGHVRAARHGALRPRRSDFNELEDPARFASSAAPTTLKRSRDQSIRVQHQQCVIRSLSARICSSIISTPIVKRDGLDVLGRRSARSLCQVRGHDRRLSAQSSRRILYRRRCWIPTRSPVFRRCNGGRGELQGSPCSL